MPILAAFASLMGHDGVGALATVAISGLMWRRSARQWFGLHCPACDGGDARPVLAVKDHFGCLRCGSSWVSRS